MKSILILLTLLLSNIHADDSGCSSINSYATRVAHITLKSEKIMNPDDIDYDKTKTVLLASQKIGDDLYKEIHHITFFKKDGGTVEVITINDTSSEECSISGVDIYLIDKKISNDYRPKSFYRTDEGR